MVLIGLDIGTTSCKAAIFDPTGRLIASASREYGIQIPQPGWAEQDAESVWHLAQEALREVITSTRIQAVEAISLSVQGEAIIPVDEKGNALRPAILGMDTRTEAQNEWLRNFLGAEFLFEHTGMPVHTINSLPKLLWLKENEPQTWSSASHFLLYEDFFIQKFTGEYVISRCLASRTQLYALQEKQWSSTILDAIELDPNRLSVIQPSGTPVGKMRMTAAHQLGLNEPILVVTGGHDQACGALGVSLTRPGLAMVSTGTAEVVEVAMRTPALNASLFQGNLSVYVHTLDELFLAMTLNHSGGLLLRWFRDVLGTEELRQAKSVGANPYDLLLAGSSPEPSHLLVLPHFSGSGTPYFDTRSKGAILGLTFDTTKTDLAKAILEGLTYELKINLDLLNQGGVTIDEFRAIGGGARSPLWLQLKADITGCRVTVPAVTDAACWGAALLAAWGARLFDNLAQAAEDALHLVKTYEPDPARSELFQERYANYRKVYPAVKPIHDALANNSR